MFNYGNMNKTIFSKTNKKQQQKTKTKAKNNIKRE
jgi:hypothetical protein